MIPLPPLPRRAVLGGGLLATAAAFAPRLAFAAAPTAQRFVFVIQRGAADGLHAVPPLGDPGYAGLRGPLLAGLAGAQRLDGMFALHPALVRTGALFAARQALALHAMASVYRDRSHFDGQNILETGGTAAFLEKTGWLNRLAGALPGGPKALALASDVPLALRGPSPVTSYAPSRLPQPGDDLMMRVAALYADDGALAALWQSALETRRLAGEAKADNPGQGGADVGKLAAALLAPADGARLMMIETGGWDTHTAQLGRMNGTLRNLDALLGALADGLGALWGQTLVLVATEFGRTAAVNGTGGTDHGTGSAMLLAGGALTGWAGAGRVLADWPGLGAAQLYERRDLRPTRAVEAAITGALARHFALDPARLARALYPDQPGLRALTI